MDMYLRVVRKARRKKSHNLKLRSSNITHYILPSRISFLSVEGCRLIAESSCIYIFYFFSQRTFYLLNMSHPGNASIFNGSSLLQDFESFRRQFRICLPSLFPHPLLLLCRCQLLQPKSPGLSVALLDLV